MENRSYVYEAVMYDGALRGWWFGVLVIVLFIAFAIVWRIRNK